MKFPVWLARKLQIKSKGHSAGVIIAVIGVAVAVAVMEISIATITGFKQEIARKVIGFDSQISVYPPYDETTGTIADYITTTSTIKEELASLYPEAEITSALRQPALIKTDDNFQAVIFTAYDIGSPKGFDHLKIIDGEMPEFTLPSSDSLIVISKYTADKLGLAVGDKATLTYFVNDEIKLRRPVISGIYTSHLEEFDKITAYASRQSLLKISELPAESSTRIEIRGLPLETPEEIIDEADVLQRAYVKDYYSGKTDGAYTVDNAVRAGALYFNWLALLDTNVVVILILMLCVASFTLASSIFMVVLERIQSIGILRAMGCTLNQITTTLTFMGLKIVIWGLIWGNIFGLGIVFAQHYLRIIPLDPEMYYLDFVPMNPNLLTILLVNVGALIISFLILLVPSSFAARIDPTKTFSYD